MIRPIRAAALAALMVLPAGLAAQQHTPDRKIDVIGLRRWTLAMIEDSLRSLRPSQSLYRTSCQYTLRDRFGFAEVSLRERDRGEFADGTSRLVYKVVEPGERDRIVYLPLHRGIDPTPDGWRDGASVFRRGAGADFDRWDTAMQYYSAYLLGAGERAEAESHRIAGGAQYLKYWRFLQRHTSDSDFARAMQVLSRDGGTLDRAVAVTMLANFPGRDDAFVAMIDELRDPAAGVRYVAQAALMTARFAAQRPERTVDFSAAVPSVQHLLDGTNVDALDAVLRTLTDLKVSREVGQAMLRGHAGRVLEQVGSVSPFERGVAVAFLRRVSGEDFGEDAGRWREWAEGL